MILLTAPEIRHRLVSLRGLRIRAAANNDVSAITNCIRRAYCGYIERMGKPPGPMLDDYKKVIQDHDVYGGEIGVLGRKRGITVYTCGKHSKEQRPAKTVGLCS